MRARAVAITGVLTACALAVNLAEGMLPMPLPGLKLGAANVFSLAALIMLGTREAFITAILRVVLAWLITGNVFALACGLCGAIPATAVMAIMVKRAKIRPAIASIAGACAFNIGQVAVVSYMVKDARAALYVLPLFAIGTVAGWVVGRLAEEVCRRLNATVTRKN